MKPNDFSGSRVLVTGGAGFIGSALVWGLNRRGCDDIVVCDRLGTDEKWRNLAPLRFADYVEAEDLLPRLQNGTLGKFDLVLHMGACSATTEKDATWRLQAGASERAAFVRPALPIPAEGFPTATDARLGGDATRTTG